MESRSLYFSHFLSSLSAVMPSTSEYDRDGGGSEARREKLWKRRKKRDREEGGEQERREGVGVEGPLRGRGREEGKLQEGRREGGKEEKRLICTY